jgi:hypothetical protein
VCHHTKALIANWSKDCAPTELFVKNKKQIDEDGIE